MYLSKNRELQTNLYTANLLFHVVYNTSPKHVAIYSYVHFIPSSQHFHFIWIKFQFIDLHSVLHCLQIIAENISKYVFVSERPRNSFQVRFTKNPDYSFCLLHFTCICTNLLGSSRATCWLTYCF